MFHQKIELSMPGSLDYAAFYTYFINESPEMPTGPKPVVVVCPGGGYQFTSDREAEPLALRLNAFGINAVVLRYSVAPAVFPAALLELAKVIQYVKTEGPKYGCDPSRIFTMGFSAGGHLAASYGTFWNRDFVLEALNASLDQDATPLTTEDLRIKGQILGYPVITSGPKAHHGSFQNLLADEYDAKKDSVSLENFVTKDTPATFIWNTQDDFLVPAENSILYVNALQAAGVPCEFHMYLSGPHGLSLADRTCSTPDYRNTHVAKWMKDCMEFIDII